MPLGHPPLVLLGRVQPAEETHQLADVVAGVVPARRPPRPDRAGPASGRSSPSRRHSRVRGAGRRRGPAEPLDPLQPEPTVGRQVGRAGLEVWPRISWLRSRRAPRAALPEISFSGSDRFDGRRPSPSARPPAPGASSPDEALLEPVGRLGVEVRGRRGRGPATGTIPHRWIIWAYSSHGSSMQSLRRRRESRRSDTRPLAIFSA